jgi:diguanylate cyclase
MNLEIAILLCCLAGTLAGVAGTSWFWRSYYHQKVLVRENAQARHAADVLLCLQELAAQVALDVGDHSSQVGEINSQLASSGQDDPAKIIEVVANLIQANEMMQMKLDSTEDKLRQQAQEIQTHATEARTDALTMLANRRAFDDELARRAAESARQGRIVSLIIADVDHFKTFNDAYGHPTGDEVLRAMAKLLRRGMRAMDLVARYGGEEFAVILPGTNLDDAGKAALRACKAIEELCLHHDGQELHITASFGVAEMCGSGDGAALLDRADKGLYAAKQGGRNCVYSNDGNESQRVLVKPPAAPAIAVAAQHPPGALAERDADVGRSKLTANGATAEPAVGRFPAADSAALPELPSRTAFCQQVRNRTAEWKRGGPTFSITLLAVDQFDGTDGERGRRVRELATTVVIRFLAAAAREMDVVGHYTPGCFALLMPTAGLPDAIRIAERLRVGLSQFLRPDNEARPLLTASVGAVQVMESDDSVSVLKRAEAALAAADHSGGNRAYYHDGERCVPVNEMLDATRSLS